MRVMLVLHELCSPPVGGVQAHVSDLAEALRRAGHEVGLVAGDGQTGPTPVLERGSWRGFPLWRIRRQARPPGPGRFASTLCDRFVDEAFGQAVRELSPDLVHVHHFMYLSAGVTRMLQEMRVPWLATFHDHWLFCHRLFLLRGDGSACSGPLSGWRCGPCCHGPGSYGWLAAGAYRLRKRWGRRLARQCPLALFPSEYLARFHVENGFPSERVRVLRHAVPGRLATGGPPRLGPGGTSASGEVLSDRPVHFGFAGTLRPHKGALVALRAFVRLPTRGVRFSVFGDPEVEPEYGREVRRLLAASGAALRPPFGRDQLDSVLSELDCSVIPSLAAENAPLLALECLARGIPVLASRIGGLPELAPEGSGVLTFPPGDEAALAELMARLANDPRRLAALASACPRVPTLDEWLVDLESLYREALGIASQGGPRELGLQPTGQAPASGASVAFPEQSLAGVSLAIPCFDGAATLGRVLTAVAALRPAPSEVLVVDDGSTDGSAAIAVAAGVRVVRHQQNRGLAAARNTALAETTGDVLVFLDADCAPRPDLLERLLPGLERAGVAGVGGCEGEAQLDATLWDRWRMAFRPQSHGPAPREDVWMLPGLCCAYRREPVAVAGGFDAEYRTNGEDVDLGLRLHAAGWRLRYEPAAAVRHLRRDGFLSLLALCWRYGYWGARASRRRGGPASRLLDGQLRWAAVSTWSSLFTLHSPRLALASPILGLVGLAGTVVALIEPSVRSRRAREGPGPRAALPRDAGPSEKAGPASARATPPTPKRPAS